MEDDVLSYNRQTNTFTASTPEYAALLARGALSMLERMMTEYQDEAERLERAIEEAVSERCGIKKASDPFAVGNLEVLRARYTAAIRSLTWAVEAVGKQRKEMGLPPHPIVEAIRGPAQ